jgi:hypothetical protein
MIEKEGSRVTRSEGSHMPTPHRFRSICLFLIFPSILLFFSQTGWGAGPNFDAFLGYSRLGNDAFYPNVGGLNGWEAALNMQVKRFLGAEGDVARYGLGTNSTIPRTTAVLFGPRITLGAAGIHVFAHGLVGGEHSANSGGPTPISGGALTVDFGGGLDVRFAPFFSWRVAADYLNAPMETPGSGSHDRFATGLVFRF